MKLLLGEVFAKYMVGRWNAAAMMDAPMKPFRVECSSSMVLNTKQKKELCIHDGCTKQSPSLQGATGVVHANVGQKVIKSNILGVFIVTGNYILMLLLAGVTQFRNVLLSCYSPS